MIGWSDQKFKKLKSTNDIVCLLFHFFSLADFEDHLPNKKKALLSSFPEIAVPS